MSKLKVLSLFSGIGAFEKALNRLEIDYELVAFSEIDKYAVTSYCEIHNVDNNLNLGDISKTDKEKIGDFDLLVGGSPCQSFSVAGKRKGFEDTRGTLVFDYIETLKVKQPKYFVYENVKGLVGHDKGNTLNVIAESFSEVGYRIDMEVLNSKYFDVPQNRERIYIVGIREDLIENEEWVIDNSRNDVLMKGKKRLKKLNIKTFNFNYNRSKNVTKSIKDILDDKVDEKFYINDERIIDIVNNLSEKQRERLANISDENIKCFQYDISGKGYNSQTDRLYCDDGVMTCVPSTQPSSKLNIINSEYIKNRKGDDSESYNVNEDIEVVGKLNMQGHECNKKVYSIDGQPPTLTTMQGGNTEPKVVIKNKINIKKNEINVLGTTLKTGAKGTNSRHWVYEADKSISGTIDATIYKQPKQVFGESTNYRIRKLTPLECWRLQGFDDDDFHRAKEKLNNTYYKGKDRSNSQLYKQAGNSITVNVLESIFKELLNMNL